jgi:putative intracellular protease/amidase
MLSTVHLAVYDTISDWETGYLVAAVNDPQHHREPGAFRVRTVGLDREPVTTMGGLRVVPDLGLDDLDPSDSAMLVLPGAHGWDTGDDLAPMAAAAARWLAADVPVAAICGATAGLARAGLLDHRRHTSAAAGYLLATGYAGADHYVDQRAVADEGLVTAGPQSPVQFACATLAHLGLASGETLEAYERLFHRGDPAAFPVLMRARTAA